MIALAKPRFGLCAVFFQLRCFRIQFILFMVRDFRWWEALEPAARTLRRISRRITIDRQLCCFVVGCWWRGFGKPTTQGACSCRDWHREKVQEIVAWKRLPTQRN